MRVWLWVRESVAPLFFGRGLSGGRPTPGAPRQPVRTQVHNRPELAKKNLLFLCRKIHRHQQTQNIQRQKTLRWTKTLSKRMKNKSDCDWKCRRRKSNGKFNFNVLWKYTKKAFWLISEFKPYLFISCFYDEWLRNSLFLLCGGFWISYVPKNGLDLFGLKYFWGKFDIQNLKNLKNLWLDKATQTFGLIKF